jgi:hypothetical protein
MTGRKPFIYRRTGDRQVISWRRACIGHPRMAKSRDAKEIIFPAESA